MHVPILSPQGNSPRSDTRVGAPPHADHAVQGAEEPAKLESLRKRFNPQLVGFGIVDSSTHPPGREEHPIRSTQPAGMLNGGKKEDQK